jgi:hypothetical protein
MPQNSHFTQSVVSGVMAFNDEMKRGFQLLILAVYYFICYFNLNTSAEIRNSSMHATNLILLLLNYNQLTKRRHVVSYVQKAY